MIEVKQRPVTMIPYLRVPGRPQWVYRFLIDEVDPDSEHRDEPWPEWMADEACLCYRAPERWQRGCPTTDLPRAPIWTPRRRSAVSAGDR